jgi:hypothetical protein
MIRIFTSETDPAEGAVYRDIRGCNVLDYGSSSSGGPGEVFPPCGTCIDTSVVGIISPPGCETWPVTDNEFGRLPTFYAGDVYIDPYGYDDRFESLDPPYTAPDATCPTPPSTLDYPDLWTRLGNISAALQSDVLQDSCYCLGAGMGVAGLGPGAVLGPGVGPGPGAGAGVAEGVERKTLAIGRPQFSRVTPVPFFAFPTVSTTSINVREFNPDGPPLAGDCCPAAEDIGDHIIAEIVDNEIQLTRNKKLTDFPELYRVDDTDPSFQVVAGYPQQCCMRDPCVETASGSSSSGEGGGTGVDDFVLRNLHFPRWPGPNSGTEYLDAKGDPSIREVRNPYEPAESGREEPLGVIPVVVDVQCHTDGKVYVYYANIVVHDGHIAGLQWDVMMPRPDSLALWAGNEAPEPPEDLVVNIDYQDREVFDSFEPIADQSKPQPWCEDTCLQAAVQMGKEDEACFPVCPAESLFCNEGEYQIISLGFGDAPQAAMDAAFANADDDTPADCKEGGADPDVYRVCYVKWNAEVGSYEAAVTFCCDVLSSSEAESEAESESSSA